MTRIHYTPHRTCPACGRRLPQTRLMFRVYRKKGREVFGECRDCARARATAYYRSLTPEQRARRLELAREWKVNNRERLNAKARERAARKRRMREQERARRARRQSYLVAHPCYGPRVPVKPVADWLKREFIGWSCDDIALRVGVDESHVLKILHERQTYVLLSTVDTIFTNADCPHLLTLYYPPDEYPLGHDATRMAEAA